MQEAEGGVPVRLSQGCRANALNLAGVQSDKRRRMISSGSAKRGLAVVEDNQEQRSRSSGKPRTPDRTQDCRRGRYGAFGDRDLKRVRAVAESKTDWLQAVAFRKVQWAKFTVSKEAHTVDSALLHHPGTRQI
jgi:hypothetical protein